jgi:hypothetical protein
MIISFKKIDKLLFLKILWYTYRVKKIILILLFITILSIRLPKAEAQGTVICSTSFGECTMSSQVCSQGYVMPRCPSGDCCREYYLQHQTCPYTLDCVRPTPTPIPGTKLTPTPTYPPYTPGNCPGPAPYCGPGRNCPQGQTCNGSNAFGIPEGCTGTCVSATPMPTRQTTGPPPSDNEITGGGAAATQDYAFSPFCSGGDTQINTAFGCIDITSPQKIIETLLKFSIGIAGGIALLLIILGGLQMMVSAGNPETLNAGKELMTSALIGLLLIVFSFFLLRLIGVDILGIPGFSK